MTIFNRSFRGRNLGGMLSQVLRPMSIAFTFLTPSVDVEGDVRLVTRAKNPISFLSCGHGRPPLLPMPRFGVAARIRVRVGGFGGMSETFVSRAAEFSFDVVLIGLVEGQSADMA